jgi:hypothetical protein
VKGRFEKIWGKNAALVYGRKQICFTSESPVGKNVRSSEKYWSCSSWLNVVFSHLGHKSCNFLSNSLLNHSLAPVSSSI